uniref:Uncharacterized protein n=1 Tax=Aegilops tauschii subsp. strangulata TaxID=200361 RepID=A0A453R9P8_AEGTS
VWFYFYMTIIMVFVVVMYLCIVTWYSKNIICML